MDSSSDHDLTFSSETTHWKWASCSRQGENHIASQLECQDAHHIMELPQGILIATVADGAGSAPMSKDGAQMAVAMLCDFLGKSIVPDKTTESDLADLLKRAFLYVAGSIQILANHDGKPLTDYHTTLSCAIATRASLAVAQIGDGAIVCWDERRNLETIAFPEHGEYANSTYFVTHLPNEMARLHIRVIPHPYQGFALTTDGLLEIAFEDSLTECKPWSPFFVPLIERVVRAAIDEDLSERMSAFLWSPKIRESTTDDLTLVIAARHAPPESTDSIAFPSAH